MSERRIRPLDARVFLWLSTFATLLGLVAASLSIQQCDLAWHDHGSPAPVITSAIVASLCFLVAYGLYALGRVIGSRNK